MLFSPVTGLPNQSAFERDATEAQAGPDAVVFFSITVQARVASRTRAHHGLLGCSLSVLFKITILVCKYVGSKDNGKKAHMCAM